MRLVTRIHVLLFSLCFLLVQSYKVVKDAAGGIFLIHPKRGTVSRVPDIETIKLLQLEHQEIPTFSQSQLSRYRMDNNSVQSLNLQVRSRDDVMRFEVLKILALSPPTFWKDTFYLGKMLNPTFEVWNGKLLFAWRNGMYNSPMNFAWFSFAKMVEGRQTSAQLGKVDGRYPYFDSLIPLVVTEYDFNHLQEDPRLLRRSDGSLTLVYTAKHSLFDPPKQCYCQLTIAPASSLGLAVSPSVLLDGHQLDPSQKNWIPLEYQNELYFIQSVNPLRVLQHNGANGSDPKVGRLKTVHSDNTAVKFPWGSQYGEFIRGGSPAISVSPQHSAHVLPRYYLAFFHSVSKLQARNALRTYFMGAVSFCPSPPFRVHAISTHPILQEKFYDGAWVEPGRTDYVMFAIGAFVRPEEPEYVYVSFGSQDKDGYLAKFHTGELFASMEIVDKCS